MFLLRLDQYHYQLIRLGQVLQCSGVWRRSCLKDIHPTLNKRNQKDNNKKRKKRHMTGYWLLLAGPSSIQTAQLGLSFPKLNVSLMLKSVLRIQRLPCIAEVPSSTDRVNASYKEILLAYEKRSRDGKLTMWGWTMFRRSAMSFSSHSVYISLVNR